MQNNNNNKNERNKDEQEASKTRQKIKVFFCAKQQKQSAHLPYYKINTFFCI